VKPTRALRQFFESHPDLRHLATQLGLAMLVGRSESLLRAVESGRLKMSSKLARALSDKIGVSKEWLLEPTVTGTEIPAVDGRPLSHETVISRISASEQNPRLTAVDPFKTPRAVEEPSYQTDSSKENKLRMAAALGEYVKCCLIERAERGETGLAEVVRRLFAQDVDVATDPDRTTKGAKSRSSDNQ